MTEVDLIIGGRSFVVACEETELEKVKEAAELLNVEAEELQSQLGRLPENKMLLLSALMNADRVIDLEIEIKSLRKSIKNLEFSLKAYKDGEDENTVHKTNNLRMEGFVEKILLKLETFVNQASLPKGVEEENETIIESEATDNNQPKLF